MSFLDYMHSTPRGCIKIVKDQRKMHLDPDRKASYFYDPIRVALRRALNSVTPQQEFSKAIDRANVTQYLHFVELERGFSKWSRKVNATGVKVTAGAWRAGDLDVTLHNLLGLRHSSGKTEAVLPYLKEAALTPDAANPILRVLEREMPALLVGASPVVLDVRRGSSFKLRRNTNRADLDALLTAEAAKYTAHWHAVAA
ncbi:MULTISPECIES: hypothetical protein [unclassified Saccharopolyspora]|uniref:hypothetical protein n=1 Tax=unclassified Saccharopolyspora TaxID=2646250 RepID=UPI001CD1FAB1|nr:MULTISPECIES: hypothetical protein [unclassified Saccharopolyspora]MCA1186483.1 hypothetical protein [Saccharopolyspora sp. 6T]MCA1192896.1 hypothetical protein [Saccharopolyspora sp. 6V]